MANNQRLLRCSPEDVFRVLADGWLYPSWVVGASRIRAVDEAWPAPQSRIQHSFGIWPMLLDDSTYVTEWDAPRRARFRARGWPVGEAFVVIEVKPRGDGCVVRIVEDAVEGPGLLVPRFIRSIGIHYRNTETLRRLGYLAEGGAGR